MIAHFDCASGISGDMMLGALVDAGADLDLIRKQVEKTAISDFELTSRTVHKRGIRATKVDVEGPGATRRAFSDYRQACGLIDDSGFDAAFADAAKEVIFRLCRAEAAVHGQEAETVHLHEIGAGDTIVDVVGVLEALRQLEVRSVTSSAVSTGTGVIESAHGRLPVPAPATLELLVGVSVRHTQVEAELTTPTGAALISYLSKDFGAMPAMTISGRGYGAGTADLEIPNVLRVTLGRPVGADPQSVEHLQLEANIDDMNPQFYEYLFEKLFAAGALDVWAVPATGKRGRPANILQVLVEPDDAAAVRGVLFTEASTIGVRALPVRRWMLERQWVEAAVEGRSVRIKIASSAGRIVNVAPEYSDCAEVARQTGLPLKEVFRRALAAAPEIGG
ncbi:MAG: nickel pincer cofactor biosynthesis protein LarC [Actinomycetota bacterium]